MALEPFRPFATATIAASTTSANASISTRAVTLEIQNDGLVTCFVRWGVGTQTAVTTDYPILPGQSKIVTCETGNNNVAVITSTGTTTVYVSSGEGV